MGGYGWRVQVAGLDQSMPSNSTAGCFVFTLSATFAGIGVGLLSASSSGPVTFISARHGDTAKPRGMAKLVLEEE